MSQAPPPDSITQPRSAVRLPLAKPSVTYLMLGAIVIVFLVETIAGGSTSMATLRRLGGQVNTLVAGGAYWRLLAAMFIHIGLTHVAFNCWALFSLGREVEAFYGALRFIAVYLISGLAGGIAYLLIGSDVLSAGASGAVFGLIGAEIAFFLRNRALFGAIGRQRLGNLAGLVAINLVLGFTIPGVNNIAHLGGLTAGLLLGLALSSRYGVQWDLSPTGMEPHLANRTSTAVQWLSVVAAVVVLGAGAWLGTTRWADSSALLNQRALAAVEENDLPLAAQLLEKAVDSDPADAQSYFNLGVVREQQGDDVAALAAFREVTRLAPEYAVSYFNIGILTSRQGDWLAATDALEQAAQLDPSSAETFYQLGIVYARQEQLVESVKALGAVLQIAPDHQDALYALGQLHAQMGRSTDARLALEKYLALNPDDEGADRARALLSSLAARP